MALVQVVDFEESLLMREVKISNIGIISHKDADDLMSEMQQQRINQHSFPLVQYKLSSYQNQNKICN